jgi:hypothetical protein
MDAGIINGQGDKMRKMQKHLDLTIHHAVKDEDDMTTKASGLNLGMGLDLRP